MFWGTEEEHSLFFEMIYLGDKRACYEIKKRKKKKEKREGKKMTQSRPCHNNKVSGPFDIHCSCIH